MSSYAMQEIRTAFEAAAPNGWTLETIAVKLQADGHSCGDWAHYFRCRVLAYVADPTKLGTCTFPAFLLTAEMRDLRGLRGTAKLQAEQHQRLVATGLRDALRQLLRAGATQGALPWQHRPEGQWFGTRHTQYDRDLAARLKRNDEGLGAIESNPIVTGGDEEAAGEGVLVEQPFQYT